jgi:hypothetical protein
MAGQARLQHACTAPLTRSEHLKRFWTRNQGALQVFAVSAVHVEEGRAALKQD